MLTTTPTISCAHISQQVCIKNRTCSIPTIQLKIIPPNIYLFYVRGKYNEEKQNEILDMLAKLNVDADKIRISNIRFPINIRLLSALFAIYKSRANAFRLGLTKK